MQQLARRVARRIALAPPWAVLAAAFLVILVYAYPGQMTQDSFDHLREARSNIFTDSHPPVVAWIWKWIDWVIPGPLGMLLLQNALFIGGLYALLRHSWEPRRAAWVTAALFVFPPIMVPMAVIWKDCLMAGFLVTGAAALLAERRWIRIAGLVSLILATAVRYNAFGATLPLVVLLFQWKDGLHWFKRYAIAFVAWLAVTFAAFGWNAALTDKKMYFWHSSLAVMDIVGTLTYVEPDLPDTELEQLFAGTDLQRHEHIHAAIRRAYRTNDFLPIVWDSETKLWSLPINGYDPAPEAQRDAIARAWWNTVTTYPMAYAHHRLVTLGEVLNSDRTADAVPKRRVWHWEEYGKELGFSTAWSKTQLRWTKILTWFAGHTPLFVVWIYALLAIVLIWPARKHRDVLALLFSGLVFESSLIFLAPANDYRYSHWMVICTCISIVLLVARRYRTGLRAVVVAPGDAI